jgi:hypothetical protein
LYRFLRAGAPAVEVRHHDHQRWIHGQLRLSCSRFAALQLMESISPHSVGAVWEELRDCNLFRRELLRFVEQQQIFGSHSFRRGEVWREVIIPLFLTLPRGPNCRTRHLRQSSGVIRLPLVRIWSGWRVSGSADAISVRTGQGWTVSVGWTFGQ